MRPMPVPTSHPATGASRGCPRCSSQPGSRCGRRAPPSSPTPFPGPEAVSVLTSVVEMLRVATSAKLALAARIDATGVARESGYRNAAAQLADIEGVGLGAASATLLDRRAAPGVPRRRRGTGQRGALRAAGQDNRRRRGVGPGPRGPAHRVGPPEVHHRAGQRLSEGPGRLGQSRPDGGLSGHPRRVGRSVTGATNKGRSASRAASPPMSGRGWSPPWTRWPTSSSKRPGPRGPKSRSRPTGPTPWWRWWPGAGPVPFGRHHQRPGGP